MNTQPLLPPRLHHRLAPWHRLSLLLGVALTAAMLTGITPATADVIPSETPTTIGAMPFGSLTPQAGTNVCPPPDVDPDCGGGGGGSGCPPFCNIPTPGCDAHLVSQSASRGNNPEFGGLYSRVQFSSKITCTGGPFASFVRAELWDRTAGGVLKYGSQVNNTTNGTSSGSIDLFDVDYYPAAQQVEQVLVVELIGPAGWAWGCNEKPGKRILWCNGVGTSVLNAGVGFYPFDTGVSKPVCTRNFQWDWTDTVAAVGVHTMATPLATFEWCVDARGRTQEARMLRFLANSRYPNLVVEPNPPNVSLVKSSDGTYVVSFAVNWRFNASTTVGIGVVGKDLLGLNFGINESCQQSVGFTLGNGYPFDTIIGTNPCKNWRPIMGQ